MNPRLRLATTLVAGILATGQACAQKTAGPVVAAAPAASGVPVVPVARALDEIFSDPLLARALMAVRVESLRTGELIYQRNSDKLVMPASNMKLLTMSVAAEKLGWDFKYETTLFAAGTVSNGVLNGDLIVVGGGDPTIGACRAASSVTTTRSTTTASDQDGRGTISPKATPHGRAPSATTRTWPRCT